jgi:hypothetical protein
VDAEALLLLTTLCPLCAAFIAGQQGFLVICHNGKEKRDKESAGPPPAKRIAVAQAAASREAGVATGKRAMQADAEAGLWTRLCSKASVVILEAEAK